MGDKAAVLSLLGKHYIPFRPEFARLRDPDGREIGEDAALFLSDIFHWSDKGSDPDGWIYKSQDEMEGETGLTRSKQEAARRKLVAVSVLEEARRGERGILHYRLDMERLAALLRGEKQIAEIPQTDPAECRISTNRFVEILQTDPPQIAEIPQTLYTEILSEIRTNGTPMHSGVVYERPQDLPPFNAAEFDRQTEVQKLITALAGVCKEACTPGRNETRYTEAAEWVLDNGGEKQHITQFGDWWRGSGHYAGRPSLTSLLNEIKNFIDGAVTPARATAGEVGFR